MDADFVLYNIKTISDVSGNLSVIESGIDIPFEIKRIYYIWNTERSFPRGYHAHKTLHQAFVCLHGSCELEFKDGFRDIKYTMNDPSICLIIPPGYWRIIRNFSINCVLMVLASDHYDENDYIRDYDEYIRYVQPNV